MSNLLQNDFSHNNITFTKDEHAMWKRLFTKQMINLKDKAYPVFFSNMEKFCLSSEKIPSLKEISERLYSASGWKVVPVQGLIDFEHYFHLLSQKKFPSTMFIRTINEENLAKDPDIFHEVFGHCTMLMSQDYADFMQEYARFALTVKECDRPLFARLIWFTTETGLINTANGVKIFGSSVISSYSESIYCFEKDGPIIKPFNIVHIFQEPYRADLLQKVYYTLDSSKQIFNVLNNIPELYSALKEARQLGEFQPLFPVEHNKYTNIGHCIPLQEIAEYVV